MKRRAIHNTRALKPPYVGFEEAERAMSKKCKWHIESGKGKT